LQQVAVQTEPPEIEPGEHCHAPYNCQYWGHCTREWKELKNPIKGLRRLAKTKRLELNDRGIEEIADVPEDFKLGKIQARTRKSVIENRAWVSDQLQTALQDFKYPVHHLDFETMGPVIPRFAGTRPFQAIPIQYSNHREEEDGSMTHLEYLAPPGGDPRRALAERLIADLGSQGSICVYSNYEKTVIGKLAKTFPDLADDLRALVPRLWDLMKVLENHYYHPGFQGSFSIKSVLPVMVPSLSYDALDIHDGMQAAREYERALELEDETEREAVFKALREYCGLDTWAMVELRRALAECA
jgi:predicted RecB family nuclease